MKKNQALLHSTLVDLSNCDSEPSHFIPFIPSYAPLSGELKSFKIAHTSDPLVAKRRYYLSSRLKRIPLLLHP